MATITAFKLKMALVIMRKEMVTCSAMATMTRTTREDCDGHDEAGASDGYVDSDDDNGDIDEDGKGCDSDGYVDTEAYGEEGDNFN